MMRLVAAACAVLFAAPAPACPVNVAETARLLRASYEGPVAEGTVRLYFAGHATFQIETPGGAVIVLDYNGVNMPTRVPDLITMNNAHITHYTHRVPPEIRTVLRGWDTGAGVPRHDVQVKDARVRSVPTNFAEMGGGTNGNSVWLVQAAGLCIAHLSHLHHVLNPAQVQALGPVDILLVPIDGRWTMSHAELVENIRLIKPALIVPMHWLHAGDIAQFLALLEGEYPVRRAAEPWLVASARSLPSAPEIVLLPGTF